mmetsp:Transcript_7307/g.9757  ORF Transcript_7307/g.9757 Transcript_7307/m.9757 type:complete len:118 (-) Transcript_7307:61-414(-)
MYPDKLLRSVPGNAANATKRKIKKKQKVPSIICERNHGLKIHMNFIMNPIPSRELSKEMNNIVQIISMIIKHGRIQVEDLCVTTSFKCIELSSLLESEMVLSVFFGMEYCEFAETSS